MPDHSHYGEYAAERHDHDPDYAEKYHRHYDGEREVEELRDELRDLRATLAEFARDLTDARTRIHQLEQQAKAA